MKIIRILTIVFLCITMMQSVCNAQHLRVYACAIGNDSTGASVGGSSNGSGLYQSDDTGKTWKHLGWDNIKCYSMDMVQSSNGRILYEATGLGILRSIDYGEHWKQITDWRISEAMDVAVNKKNPNEIYIATAHGPWRTGDGGIEWNSDLNGIVTPYCSRIVIDYMNDSILLIASEDGIYRSNNTSKDWISINGPSATREIVQGNKQFNIVGEDSMCFFLNWSGNSIRGTPVGFSSWCVSRSTPIIFGGPGQVAPVAFGGPDGLFESRIWKGRDTIMDCPWLGGTNITLENRQGVFMNVLGTPNIASCIDVGSYRISGSLGNGILKAIRNSYEITFPAWNKEIWDSSLSARQIWTLKSFLVTP